MAITRTQIAKQLLAQGGRTGFQGGGADMGRERGSETGRAPGPVGGGNRDGRDPSAQFGKTPEERAIVAAAGAREMAKRDVPIGLGDKLGIPDFFATTKMGLNLFKDKAIASKATTELLTQPLVMEESEVLKVQAADANELHVIASILEIQPREVTA